MKRQLLLIIALLPVALASAQVPMRDIFAAMPDSVLPLVTKNDRLDCIDFIENHMEAKVRNRMGAFVQLDTLTADYLRFRTSKRAWLEMRSLTWQPNDSTSQQLVALVQTVEGGFGASAVRHSNLRFINPDWPPAAGATVAMPPLADYFTGVLTDSALVEPASHARLSLAHFTAVELRLSASAPTLTCLLQTGDLSREEREAATQLVQPVVLHWQKTGWR